MSPMNPPPVLSDVPHSVAVQNIKQIVFDVGGVLVELTGGARLIELTANRYQNEAELHEAWICSPAVQLFERGQCNADAFAAAIVSELALPISKQQFIQEFTSWANGLLPGAKDLLEQLKQSYPIACLSNTNVIHWPHQKDSEYLNRIFDQMFLSYEMGMVKPHTEIYHAMIEHLDVAPENILFLDDNQINVDAARTAGLHAELARGIGEARTVLKNYGLIPGR